MVKKTQKSGNNILKFGVLLFCVSFLTTGFIYFISSKKTKSKTTTIVSVPKVTPSIILYKDNKFGYTVSYSSNLTPKIIENQGGFLQFVRFESKLNSTDQGFAIGVSALPFESEITRIKENFSADENAILYKEKNTVFKGFSGKELYYKPIDAGDGEDRLIVVFNKDKFTYSISASPENIDAFLNSFNLVSLSPTSGL